MTDLTPVQPDAVEPATPLLNRAELLRRISATHDGSDLPEDMRLLYRDLVDALLQEAEQVPGFGVAMALNLERYAWLWASMKFHDLAPDRTAALDPVAYQQLLQRFRQLWETALRTRDDRQADEVFKRNFATNVISAVGAILDAELGAAEATRLSQMILEHLRRLQVTTNRA